MMADDDKNGDHDGYFNKPGLVGMARVSESQFYFEGMHYGGPKSLDSHLPWEQPGL